MDQQFRSDGRCVSLPNHRRSEIVMKRAAPARTKFLKSNRTESTDLFTITRGALCSAAINKDVSMRLPFLLVFPLASLALTAASAVVIRHDVSDTAYTIPTSEFPALVDLPHEGHGVLISPRWIVTVAHTTQFHPVKQVMIRGRARSVEKVIVHPGYIRAPQVPPKGDMAPFMAAMASSDDIALIKLSQPLNDVTPVAMYRSSDEQGKLGKFYGKGATGNGLTGVDMHASHRGSLRRAYNRVSSANGKWLTNRFDAGPEGHPLEGIGGSGDSGGPLLIEVNGKWTLAGLTAWQFATGDISDNKPGRYGQVNYLARISHYAQWIDRVIAAQ
jgi:hypothetical protein